MTTGTPLRTLRVGEHRLEDLRAALDRQQVGLNESAEILLARPEMTCAPVALELVAATPSDLGLPEGGTLEQVFAAAADHGLRLCPLATGPTLRLVHREPESADAELRRHRPPDLALHVASAALDDAFDAPQGFYLRTVAGQRWLRGYRCAPEYLLPPTMTFIFAR